MENENKPKSLAMGVRSDGENDARHLLPKAFSSTGRILNLPCLSGCVCACVCVQALQLHCAYNCDAWLKRALTSDNKAKHKAKNKKNNKKKQKQNKNIPRCEHRYKKNSEMHSFVFITAL